MLNFVFKSSYIFTSLYVAGYKTLHSRYGYEYGKGVIFDGKNYYDSTQGTSSARTKNLFLDRQTGERFRTVRRSCRRLRVCSANSRSDNNYDPHSPFTDHVQSPHVMKNPKHRQGKAGSAYQCL